MTSDGQSPERLQEYIRNLKPEARALLLQQLERGLLDGTVSSRNHAVLEELRRVIRVQPQAVPRIGDAERLFFAPLEPFLFEGPADHKRIGRISRSVLEPIWQWLSRDLMPAEIKALKEDIHRALLANDKSKADQLLRALHDRAVLRLRQTLSTSDTDERTRRRLAIQVGTPRALEDITTLLRVLEIRDVLADLARRLPSGVRAFERDVVEQVKVQLDSATNFTKAADGGAGRKPDVIRYGLVVAMNRLAAPWQIIRIATRAAESDDTARIGETPYAAAVTIVLGEMEYAIEVLRTEFKAGRPVTAVLKELHDAARGLRTEIDLSDDSAWSKQLTALRSEISKLLRPEIDATPGHVRRLLRPRPAKEIRPGATVDSLDVDEAEMRVEFVSACRNYAGELALSEVTLRAYSDLTQYLETGTKVLLDTLRHAGDADRPFRQSQVDAAIRLCRTMFGAEYAGLLAKAAEIAMLPAGAERKPARA
jgi:hypothetical protein